MKRYPYAGGLLALLLACTLAMNGGCEKSKRTGTVYYGDATVAVPIPPSPQLPAQPQYAPAAPSAPQAPQAAPPVMQYPPAPPAEPQYSQAVASAQPQYPSTVAAQPLYPQTQPPPAPEYPQMSPLAPTVPIEAPPPPSPEAAATGVEVLTRGPVHEAYAEPVVSNPTPGFIVPRQPPAPIAERPPAVAPTGQPVVWIPGYWGWDDDRQDFIWISGIWRSPPPGCSWVPGYWVNVANGWQWVQGFWVQTAVHEVEYLPQPPASLDAGPIGVAPGPDYIWVSGCWNHESMQYRWRSGFWELGRPNWLWVPAHYIWTPRGCVFVGGYWDYDVTNRGVLFAPVYFVRPMYYQPGYFYSPDVVIDTSCFSIAFFSRPMYRHYYFGDYFDAGYGRYGFYPWYECRTRHDWYDPIYLHASWSNHRADPRWDEHERDHYDRLRADRAERPASTFAAQQVQALRFAAVAKNNVTGTRGTPSAPPMLARSLADVAAGKGGQKPFVKLNDTQRTAIEKQGGQLHDYRNQRAAWESKSGDHPVNGLKGATTSAMPPTAKNPLVPATGTRTPPQFATPDTKRPPMEVKRPDTFVPQPAEIRRPSASVTPAPQPAEIRRPSAPVTPVPQPAEIKRPSAPVPEIRRPEPPVRTPAPEVRTPAPEIRRPEPPSRDSGSDRFQLPRSPIVGPPAEVRSTPPASPPSAPPSMSGPQPRGGPGNDDTRGGRGR